MKHRARHSLWMGWGVTLVIACGEAREPEGGLGTSHGSGAGSGNDQTSSTGTDDDPTDGPSSSGTTGGNDPTGDPSGESGTGASDGGEFRFDVAPGWDGGNGGDGTSDEGCTKIDFLFVIDNSGSMLEEQELLAAGFPTLMDAIQEELPDAADFHVGVTSTDPLGGPRSPDACIRTHGGLIDRSSTGSWFLDTGEGDPCGFSSGERYMTNSPTLADEFSCAAQLGTGGDVAEQHLSSMVAALSPAMTDPGGCNEGFLRDDALLVVVTMTDEDDTNSPPDGYPWDDPDRIDGYFEDVVDVKGGLETNITQVLIFQGDPEYPGCDTYGNGPVLRKFAERFTHHHLGNICEPGYDQILRDAVSVIGTACDDFVPPG